MPTLEFKCQNKNSAFQIKYRKEKHQSVKALGNFIVKTLTFEIKISEKERIIFIEKYHFQK
jgi:hypothetical protein